MNYYISDMHCFCKSQTNQGHHNYDDRPFETVEEMHEHFLTRWNSKITNADKVFILGDLAFRGRNDAMLAFVSQLKGHKVLVRGNHDDTSDYRYQRLFEEITDYKEIKDTVGNIKYKLVLCHFPILFWKDQHRGTILLYGHTHNSVEEAFFQKCIAELNNNDELKLRRPGGHKVCAINVGCMMPYMNYEPRTLEEIMGYIGHWSASHIE